MTRAIAVAGTDTEIGKTVFSAGLAMLLGAAYWKPIQSGLDGETDTQAVKRLAGLPDTRLLPEGYRLKMPASPYVAAMAEGVAVDRARLAPPRTDLPLLIEQAGGIMVPVSREVVNIDLLADWGAPVVLCARTKLGTINHSLLSLEALHRRGIAVLGVAFIGEGDPPAEEAICRLGQAKRLGRLPWLSPLTPDTLRAAMGEAFNAADFAGAAP